MIDLAKESIRALSWKEPFGTLMLHGKIETRVWNTAYRGLVLICTSQKAYTEKQMISICGPIGANSIMAFMHDKETPIGCAIAVGRLKNCYPMNLSDEKNCFVNYHPDLFCHHYVDVKPIKPFSWKGSQKWGKISREVINKIEFL